MANVVNVVYFSCKESKENMKTSGRSFFHISCQFHNTELSIVLCRIYRGRVINKCAKELFVKGFARPEVICRFNPG